MAHWDSSMHVRFASQLDTLTMSPQSGSLTNCSSTLHYVDCSDISSEGLRGLNCSQSTSQDPPSGLEQPGLRQSCALPPYLRLTSTRLEPLPVRRKRRSSYPPLVQPAKVSKQPSLNRQLPSADESSDFVSNYQSLDHTLDTLPTSEVERQSEQRTASGSVSSGTSEHVRTPKKARKHSSDKTPTRKRSFIDLLVTPKKRLTVFKSKFAKSDQEEQIKTSAKESPVLIRDSLRLPKKAEFSVSSFTSPEPETFVVEMKLKEKLKLNKKGSTKRSADFSDLSFGATQMSPNDDGGFSQFQQLQQSFFNRADSTDSPFHHDQVELDANGVPAATTLTRKIKSVVDKPGSQARGGKDHSNCLKCNKNQPDTFHTFTLPHDHAGNLHKRKPSDDSMDGHGQRRPRYASESNLLGAPLKTFPLGYSPSVTNVYPDHHHHPHDDYNTMRQPGLAYIQCGNEVKKVLLPRHHLPTMHALHELINATFPISVTVDDLASRRKVVYMKDPQTGIFYELEDISDVKEKSFLSVRNLKPLGGAMNGDHMGASRSATASPVLDRKQGGSMKLSNSELMDLKAKLNAEYRVFSQQQRELGSSKNQGLPYLSPSTSNLANENDEFLQRSSSFSQESAAAGARRTGGTQTLGRSFGGPPPAASSDRNGALTNGGNKENVLPLTRGQQSSLNNTTNSHHLRETIENSTVVIKDSPETSNKLSHIEVQLTDLQDLVHNLLKKGAASREDDGSALHTFETLERTFKDHLSRYTTDTASRGSSVEQYNALLELRERVRHLRLELNQLRRTQVQHTNSTQLMMKENMQKVNDAINAFVHNLQVSEEAKSRQMAALSQAWYLHVSTLDKLETEIGEMEAMVEQIKAGAAKGHLDPFQVEQLNKAVSDTGDLISKVKVDLLEFEAQLSDLMKMGGTVTETQKRLLREGPARLEAFLERIRRLNTHLMNLKRISLEQNRPQSTPPQMPREEKRSLTPPYVPSKHIYTTGEISLGSVPARPPPPADYSPSQQQPPPPMRSSSHSALYEEHTLTSSGALANLLNEYDMASLSPRGGVRPVQVKKRSDEVRSRRRGESTSSHRERSESVGSSILDTAYALDADDLEVINRNNSIGRQQSSSTRNVHQSSEYSTRVNRETLIDEYYATLRRLQSTNRELARSRCRRTDMIVNPDHPVEIASTRSSPTPSSAGGGGGGSGGKAKQVTTYTYYTITKDGKKKTVFGGKEKKLVPATD